MNLSLPRFFNWDGEAVKFVSTADGGMDVIGFPVGKPVRWVKYSAPISRDATPISEEAFNKLESEVKNMTSKNYHSLKTQKDNNQNSSKEVVRDLAWQEEVSLDKGIETLKKVLAEKELQKK